MALKLYCNYNMFDKEQKIISYDDKEEKLEVLATCSTDQLNDVLSGLILTKNVIETNLKGPEQVLSKVAEHLKTRYLNNEMRIFINGKVYN